MENLYHVYNSNSEGEKKGGKLFIARESSGCCNRLFCSGMARPLEIKIEHVSRGSTKNKTAFLELKKPCKCFIGGCCCNRPELDVHDVENDKREILGKIKFPW